VPTPAGSVPAGRPGRAPPSQAGRIIGEAGGRWKALLAEREKKGAKGVRFLKEGEGEKLVEVRVFANAQHTTEPVPAEWLP
jgi:hypothetical protein